MSSEVVEHVVQAVDVHVPVSERTIQPTRVCFLKRFRKTRQITGSKLSVRQPAGVSTVVVRIQREKLLRQNAFFFGSFHPLKKS